MSATKSIGTKIVTAMIATGLAVTAAFAGSTVTVTLPESVSVGNTTLSAGQYTVTEFAMSGGNTLFVFRSDKGETASALGMKNADAGEEQKTEVVLTHEGKGLHLDKMFIEGEGAGYQFAASK